MEQTKRLNLGSLAMDYYYPWSNPPDRTKYNQAAKVGIDLDEEISESRTLRRIDAVLYSSSTIPLLLHWSDGTNLKEVDRKVAEGSSTPKDFEGAIVGQELTTKCSVCGTDFLIVRFDTVPVLDSSSSGESQERYRRHKFVENCPSCGSRWLPSVLEVISQVAPPTTRNFA
ncbi:hypothetical protein [Nocardia rosealba]|uniref:hypothetical protein n=1 Tax=Nocardia rosealba TaxID=2878563 RepID=UPI001CD9498D|nr:hypothetical protein [Nocardia rosealba]MCA2205864.1 hypothetical protein [Nocardia rosealba]